MWARIIAVIRREYLERVRTKAFWISTLLVPLFLGAVMIIPAYLAARGGGEFSVAVLDLGLVGHLGKSGPWRRPGGHQGKAQDAGPAEGF
jgi:ABC-2 type transport system permease protein